jgi:hypothetical protein
MAVAVDAEPTLVVTGSLREYASPKDAIAGLYKRWDLAREPMVLLRVTYPLEEVRNLAFEVQAELEMVLRETDDVVKSQGSLDNALALYHTCLEKLGRLGGLISTLTH